MSRTALMTPAQLKSTLEEHRPHLTKLLPTFLTPERFLDLVLQLLPSTPRLNTYTPESIIGAVYQAAKAGMELGIDAHLVPFYNRKERLYEAVFIPDYKGIIRALERTGKVAKVFAECVHHNDHFEMDYGTGTFSHRPCRRGKRGSIDGAYGCIVMKDGTQHVHYMPWDDFDRVRGTAPGRDQDTWVKHTAEMCRKTALKNVAKYVQLSPQVEILVETLEPEEPTRLLPEVAADAVANLFGERSNSVLTVSHHDSRQEVSTDMTGKESENRTPREPIPEAEQKQEPRNLNSCRRQLAVLYDRLGVLVRAAQSESKATGQAMAPIILQLEEDIVPQVHHAMTSRDVTLAEAEQIRHEATNALQAAQKDMTL